MKIEWLDAKREQARLTRGFWRWKWTAIVVLRKRALLVDDWCFKESGEPCPKLLDTQLWIAKHDAEEKAKPKARNWRRMRALPRAKVV